jgi:hypothetical protein
MIRRKIAMAALLGAMALTALTAMGIQVAVWINAVSATSSPVLLAGPLVPPIGPP